MSHSTDSNQIENEVISTTSGESGQVFFEFILLLLVMITLSYTMLYGVNSQVAERWKSVVHLVTKVENSAPPQLN